MLSTYRLFLSHYDLVRSHWDRGHTTLVHGDAHVGNYYFEEQLAADGAEGAAGSGDGTRGAGTDPKVVATRAGLYDFQCVAVEHPMRDVVYHTMSSVSEEVVRELGGDQQVVKRYLERFHRSLEGRGRATPEQQPGKAGTAKVQPFAPTDDAGSDAKAKASGEQAPALSFEDAWRNYRLHGCWVLAAWIISAGAGEKLFEADKARFILGRISRACERVDVRAALLEFLRAQGAVPRAI